MITSYLFVPGNRPDRIEKAFASQASAVIIDLEDAIPQHEKGNIREVVREFLLAHDFANPKKLCVRINDVSTPYFEEDVSMVAEFPNVHIMLPKTNSASDILTLEERTSPSQFILPLIEMAKGVLCAYEIASCSKRVTVLAFGAVDYCLDINISISSHGHELIYPRSALVLASRAAGLEPPIDTVYIDLSNEDGLINEIHRVKDLGMFSKLCIHPTQIELVNTLFAPSSEEITWAKKVVESFEHALVNNLSAIKVDNKMIDLPVYNQALATLKKTSE